ncbi:MAG: energy transducer TonB, partial [Bacteroidota bacterium]
MRVILIIALLSFSFFQPVFAQEEAKDTSKIFKVTDQAPLFPGCSTYSEADLRRKCSDKLLLEYVYRYLVYPDTALEAGLEGTVVVNFVVEKDGSISNT